LGEVGVDVGCDAAAGTHLTLPSIAGATDGDNPFDRFAIEPCGASRKADGRVVPSPRKRGRVNLSLMTKGITDVDDTPKTRRDSSNKLAEP
jgi:hypothetical protein